MVFAQDPRFAAMELQKQFAHQSRRLKRVSVALASQQSRSN